MDISKNFQVLFLLTFLTAESPQRYKCLQDIML